MTNNVNNSYPENSVQSQQPSRSLPDLDPTVPTTPQAHHVSFATSEVGLIKPNDLVSVAVNECIKSNGNLQKLRNMIQIVTMSYKMEAIAEEEKIKAELSNEINRINNKIIQLNNEIANIREFLIPNKEKDLEEYKKQLEMLANNSQYDLNTDMGSELYTIIEVSSARTKEHIRKFHSKIIQLKTAIEQEKNSIDVLTLQLKNVNMFTKDILTRRLSIFFGGWTDGLIGMGVEEEEIQNTNRFIENFLKNEINEFFRQYAPAVSNN
jgi:hypothetical protein